MRKLMFFSVLLLTLLLSTQVMAAGVASPEACLECHDDVISAEEFAASVHGPNGCVACHVELVDIDALAQALEAGEIAGAALDVLPQEPPPDDCPLFGRDDVILTPHTGFYSADALLDLQTTVATDVASVLNGEFPRFPVNPSVRDPQ